MLEMISCGQMLEIVSCGQYTTTGKLVLMWTMNNGLQPESFVVRSAKHTNNFSHSVFEHN